MEQPGETKSYVLHLTLLLILIVLFIVWVVSSHAQSTLPMHPGLPSTCQRVTTYDTGTPQTCLVCFGPNGQVISISCS